MYFFYREHHNFLKLCLKLLSNHLALALAGGVATSILGRQAGPLRNLLFRLMDSSVPDEIQEVSNALLFTCENCITLLSFFSDCVVRYLSDFLSDSDLPVLLIKVKKCSYHYCFMI